MGLAVYKCECVNAGQANLTIKNDYRSRFRIYELANEGICARIYAIESSVGIKSSRIQLHKLCSRVSLSIFLKKD